MKIKNQLLLFTLLIGLTVSAQPCQLWVSPTGNDQNNGTKDQPFATVQMAQRMARELRRLDSNVVQEGIDIILQDGVYMLAEPIFLRPEDSGSETSPTTFKAAKDATPILSGGVKITNWSKVSKLPPGLPAEAKDKLWEANAPVVGGRRLAFRQLWINNIKTTRASNLNDGELDRILSVNNKAQAIWIPTPKVAFNEIAQLEFIIHQWWAIANLRVKSMEVAGDSTKLTFHQPESRVEFEHPWPAPFIDANNEYNGNSAFFFANSISLLNEPGEWYLSEQNGKIYYWPRQGEDLNSASVIAPYLETLLSIDGNINLPVEHVNFQGINFEHTTWMRPSEAGHVPLQAGMYLYDAYKLPIPGTPDKATLENQAWVGRQPAAVEAAFANNIKFQRCNFQHLAATGLDFIKGVQYSSINGCLFSDIGGTGIQTGFFGDKSFEAHLPYNPTDKRELCNFIYVANNLVTDVTNEDWGCVGISVGYAHDVTIEHNEVSHLNYSGICVGWGWTKTITCMKNNYVHANYIHHFARNMFDVGGVYTLSAQPNSEISENRIEKLMKAPYAHIPEHFQYIYYDEGSSYIRSENNYVEKAIFFENNPGPGNFWLNNYSDVAAYIKANAGLTVGYKDLREAYKQKGLAKVVADDMKRKTVEYGEDHHFLEDGRGPR